MTRDKPETAQSLKLRIRPWRVEMGSGYATADSNPPEPDVGIATPDAAGGIERAVKAGEAIAGRRHEDQPSQSDTGDDAELALLVWPVISAFDAAGTEALGMEKWTRASMGPWDVPEELAPRIRAVVALVGSRVIGAWQVVSFQIQPRTLPTGKVELGCTFAGELDARLDALIGRGIDPAIETHIYMYAELELLMRAIEHRWHRPSDS